MWRTILFKSSLPLRLIHSRASALKDEGCIDQYARKRIKTESPLHTTAYKVWADLDSSLSALKKANVTNRLLPNWYLDLLFCLAGEAGLNFVRLVKAEKDLETAVVAYSARNLLELNVWCKYCCASHENGQKFREDIFRDFKGVQKALEGLSALFPDRPSSVSPDTLEHMEVMIERKASEFGMSGLDTNYTKVRKVAEELGLKHLFENTNKLLSKLTHPTAFVVLTYPQGKPLADICHGAANIGAYFFESCASCLSSFIHAFSGVTLPDATS